jgi:CheY-like chemotaxis protein
MPRKTGFECLSEIRGDSKLSDLLVFVFTISYPSNKDFEIEIKTTLNKMGAQEYITKNYNFEEFKQTIHTAINSVIEKNSAKRAV